VLALATEAQPINKFIKITQHNMNTLCRYLRHMVESTFPVVELEELHINSQFGLESLSCLGNSIFLFDIQFTLHKLTAPL
jgi:hypothetical protein